MINFKLFSKKKKQTTNENPLAARDPRVTIAPLHNIYFRMDAPKCTCEFKLANISASGIALFIEEPDLLPLPPDTNINGTLHLQNSSQQVKMTVIHANNTLMGCRFSGETTRLTSLIDQYFQVELAAMKLEKIDPKFLKQQDDGEVSWFRGADNCELYTVSKSDEVIRFNLTFFGNHIDFDKKFEIKFGTFKDDISDAMKYKGTQVIDQKKAIPKDIGESSIKFVDNVKGLPKKYRDFIKSVITKATTEA